MAGLVPSIRVFNVGATQRLAGVPGVTTGTGFMLTRLSIRDIVLIDRLDIDFASGLSVLTGETGAGKSILLDSFALALGARGDAGLVRQGVEQGQVTAAFDLAKKHPAYAVLADNDIVIEDELILRRVQFADGRTRAFVNDQPVGVQILRSLGSTLVEIHGQHDDRALVDAATHRRLLDAFGGLENAAADITRLWDARRSAEEAVAEHCAGIERAQREAGQAYERALRAADHDPLELERIEERLFALRAAGRKYNTPVDGLAALAARYVADLALIDAGAERLLTLEQAAREAGQAYDASAKAISSKRKKAAEKLDKTVNAELAPLKLERAKFSTALEITEPGPHGIDRAEFWVQTNPGTKPGPMMKVASGGELARFMLALKVVLADRGSAPTLVFDEIDTGVGGAVADAIGMRLAKLGGRVQALAVTHAPQVAARADHHYLISKDALDKGKRVATRVAELAKDHRREEIARMLAGAEITAEARAAADRLIKAAS